MLNISVIQTDSTITVSDGKRTRQKTFLNPTVALSMVTKFTNNPAAGAKWLGNAEPEPRGLPADIAGDEVKIFAV